MKIKNIGSRLVGIGGKLILPDEVAVINDEWKDIPSVQLLAQEGYITILDSEANVKSGESVKDSKADDAPEPSDEIDDNASDEAPAKPARKPRKTNKAAE